MKIKTKILFIFFSAINIVFQADNATGFSLNNKPKLHHKMSKRKSRKIIEIKIIPSMLNEEIVSGPKAKDTNLSNQKFDYAASKNEGGDYKVKNLNIEALEIYQKIINKEMNNPKNETALQTYDLNPSQPNLSGLHFEKMAFKNILGNKPPLNWQFTIQECTTILCALTKLFNSEESAQRALSIHYYSGYAVSLDQEDHHFTPERIFSTEEVRQIDIALRLLPKNLYHLSELKSFVTADSKPGAAGTSLFQNVNSSGRILFRANANYGLFLHEFGHHVDANNSYDGLQINYTNFISKTNKFLDIFWQNGNQNFLKASLLAHINELEAFAEIFKYYILWPQKILETNPKGHEYLKQNIFNGKVYPSNNMDYPPINQFPELILE